MATFYTIKHDGKLIDWLIWLASI